MNADTDRERKNRIRREILEARSRLSKAERDEKSLAICSRLLALPEFDRAEVVMAYMAFRNEAGTADFIEECFKRGKRVALPVMADAGGPAGELRAFEACRGQGLPPNRFGICEPDPDTAARVDEAEIDLVLVPGVAFDAAKSRIGYGAGCYDRFLAGLGPECRRAGIAFDLQIVEGIPAEEHDIKMDMVITEYRVVI